MPAHPTVKQLKIKEKIVVVEISIKITTTITKAIKATQATKALEIIT